MCVLDSPFTIFVVAEMIIRDFESFRLGPRTGKKDRENVRTSSSHVHRFCLYMAAGLPSGSSFKRDLRFLGQMAKLRKWPGYLAQKGYAPTSIKTMLNHVSLFFKHVENSFQTPSKLKLKELRHIQYELKRIKCEVQRKVTVHRQRVMHRKTGEVLGRASVYR